MLRSFKIVSFVSFFIISARNLKGHCQVCLQHFLSQKLIEANTIFINSTIFRAGVGYVFVILTILKNHFCAKFIIIHINTIWIIVMGKMINFETTRLVFAKVSRRVALPKQFAKHIEQ